MTLFATKSQMTYNSKIKKYCVEYIRNKIYAAPACNEVHLHVLHYFTWVDFLLSTCNEVHYLKTTFTCNEVHL